MEEEILKLIMVHLSYLDQLKNLTLKLERSFREDELDSLLHFSLNRERLLKIIQGYEVKILDFSSKNKMFFVIGGLALRGPKIQKITFFEKMSFLTFLGLETIGKRSGVVESVG